MKKVSPQSQAAVDVAGGSVHRDLRAIAERVLVVGLDGATWDVLNPMMAAGQMPNLKAFVERGTSGILESTKPPVTPAAWTTFMTGKCPGTHGIVDFERYDIETNSLVFNSHRSVAHVRTLWDMLGDKGLKVGVVAVPMTYPPRTVNGFLVTGFETPNTKVDFTHPADLKGELLSRWPDYTFKSTWRRKTFGGEAVFHDNLRRFCRSFHQNAEITIHFGDKLGWDVSMVVFKLVDNLQHKAWKYIDPRLNAGHEARAAAVADCFNELDDALGKLFEHADRHNATVFIMSDHGHGSLEGKAQANWLLKEWGYLALDSAPTRARTRLTYLADRALRRKKGRFNSQRQITQELAVDFTKTQACVMHAGEYGHLYLNLKGRQPGGIVDPADYERLRDEIRERFLSERAKGPDGRELQLFQHVTKPEDVYGCTRAGREWMPDLFLKAADGVSVVRKIRGRGAVHWLPWRRIEGTHRFEGMFAAAGPGIVANAKARAAILDSTPTILAMLGLRIPDDVEGRVIEELFASPIEFESERAVESNQAAASADSVFDEEQERQLSERLADLGYLD